MISSMSKLAAMSEKKAAPPRSVVAMVPDTLACQSRIAASTKAGAAINKQKVRMRRSNGALRPMCFGGRRCGWGAESLPLCEVGSDSILLHPAIERSTAQSQGFCRMADIAARTRESLANENTFHGFEAQLVETLGGGADLAQAKVGGLYTGTAGHEHGAFNCVIEFPHVARPAVCEHGFQGTRLKAGGWLAIARGIAGKKVPGKHGDIFAAVTQWGKMNLDGVEAEQEIFAEAALGALLLQVGVGSREQTHIHSPGLRRANPLQVASLEHAQQLGLLAHGDIGNLIQEESPPVGEFEAANAICACIGKRSFYVAEELA